MSGLCSSFTRKWLVTGMPSPMLKSNKNNYKQNSPRIVVSWTTPVVSDKPWSVIVGGGGVKSLPFCLGTAYNVSSMEDKPWSVIVGGGGVKSLPFCLGTAYNVSSMEDIGNSSPLC